MDRNVDHRVAASSVASMPKTSVLVLFPIHVMDKVTSVRIVKSLVVAIPLMVWPVLMLKRVSVSLSSIRKTLSDLLDFFLLY